MLKEEEDGRDGGRGRVALPAIPPAVKGLRGDELLQPADTLLERFITLKVKV